MSGNSSPSTVAILGLGIMGSALARHVLDAGFHVRGFDPDTEAAGRARGLGVTVTSTASEAAQGSVYILASLPSEAALSATVDAMISDAANIANETVLVELSTLSIASKVAARDRLAAHRIEMLDCPISGTGAQALTKDIVLYASGKEESYAACQPVFNAMARDHVFLGAFGNGTRMKFIANLLVAVHNVASAEALALAKQAGLDPQQVFDVISSGAGNSRIFELRGPMMVRETYAPATMKLDVWQKDMALIQDFVAQVGASTPLFDATKPLYQRANEMGLGGLDTAAVLEALKR